MQYSLLLIRCIVHYNNLKSISVDYQFALILATGNLKGLIEGSFNLKLRLKFYNYKLDNTLDCFVNP